MKRTRSVIMVVTSLLLVGLAFYPSIQAINLNTKQSYSSDEEIIQMIEQVNEGLVFYYLENLVDFGPRYTGSLNCSLAGDYIYNEFEKMGLDVGFHDWSSGGFKSSNVVATLRGVNSSDNAIFIFSAHYDTVPQSPGADDDGSGVAAVLAAAQIMSQYSFNHTIRFIAFTGEEVGTYGSYNYARDAYDRGDNIVGVFNADMVGYAGTAEGGRIIRFFHPERSAWIADFAKKVSKKYMDLIDLSVESLPNYRGSDHQAFVDYGYDGAWIAHHDGHPWGHSPEDTADHLNRSYQVKATKLLLAIMAELANKPIDIQVIIKNPLESHCYLFDRFIFPLDFGKQWYREIRGTTIIFGKATASAEVITKEEIEFIIFCIDDNFITWDSEPPFEWEIQGKQYPPMGRHKLKVYAYTKTGKFATDEMDIIIFTLMYQYRKW